jgi:MscS family membrane protein
LSEATGDKLSKKDAGRLRLLAEKEVDTVLQQIERGFDDLSEKIKGLERGGLDKAELISVQQTYLDIARLVGLKVVKEPGKRSKSRLEEPPEGDLPESLLTLVRVWYQAWLKDPDLVPEDRRTLGDEWEQKLGLLELKMNKLYQKIANPGGEETRLDDYAKDFVTWLHEYFKESKITWKEPKIRLTNITGGGMEFTVRFYVDNIKLEHWERGYRINNEIRREMIRRLRLAYIYNA